MVIILAASGFGLFRRNVGSYHPIVQQKADVGKSNSEKFSGGSFLFQSEPSGVESSKYNPDQQIPLFEEVVEELNRQFILPQNIDIAYEDCGSPDSWYDEERHRVTICHELAVQFHRLFSERLKDKAKIESAMNGTMTSMLLHEVGHAMVDALDLPITGREEDAADQISALLLINRGTRSQQMVLDAADTFKLLADLEKHQRPVYWDEHSQDAQRFYDTMCIVYGSDSHRFKYLVRPDRLPAERADMCGEDYSRIKNSWKRLLAPYSRQDLWSAE